MAAGSPVDQAMSLRLLFALSTVAAAIAGVLTGGFGARARATTTSRRQSPGRGSGGGPG